MGNLTLRQRIFALPLFILSFILLVVWVFDYNLWPLYMITMILIVFFEELWTRRESNLGKGEGHTPVADSRGYFFAVILNVAFLLLFIFRTQLSYTIEFLALMFGLFVGTFNLFLIARFLVDRHHMKKRNEPLQTLP
ncbi:MAG: hypothetical protein ACFFF4_08965 [Candidatus Thorarchaeota archaeon]